MEWIIIDDGDEPVGDLFEVLNVLSILDMRKNKTSKKEI